MCFPSFLLYIYIHCGATRAFIRLVTGLALRDKRAHASERYLLSLRTLKNVDAAIFFEGVAVQGERGQRLVPVNMVKAIFFRLFCSRFCIDAFDILLARIPGPRKSCFLILDSVCASFLLLMVVVHIRHTEHCYCDWVPGEQKRVYTK